MVAAVEKIEMSPNGREVYTFDARTKNGKYIFHYQNDSIYQNVDVEEGAYVNGVRQGKYIVKNLAGDIEEGMYVNGKKEGKAKYTWADGTTLEFKYVDGVRTGKALVTWKNGDKEEKNYEKGVLKGKAKKTILNDIVEEFTYVDGVLNGEAKSINKALGAKVVFNYVNGLKEGKSIVTYDNGMRKEENYKKDKKHGFINSNYS